MSEAVVKSHIWVYSSSLPSVKLFLFSLTWRLSVEDSIVQRSLESGESGLKSHLLWLTLWPWGCHIPSPRLSPHLQSGVYLLLVESGDVSMRKFPKDSAHNQLLVKRKVLLGPHYNKALPKSFARIQGGNVAPFPKKDDDDSKLIDNR